MIAIIDYRAGNLTSVKRALDALGVKSIITDDPELIKGSERLIFPGVGAAGKAMQDLKKLGLDIALTRAFNEGKPMLGICLGIQIIMEFSEENSTSCLGLIQGVVKRFPPDMKEEDGSRCKVPHMGWNGLRDIKSHPVLRGIHQDSEFYFVHSYYPVPSDDGVVLARTKYGIEFASIIGKKNLIAVQFHVEKSGRPGLQILSNFSKWDGKF